MRFLITGGAGFIGSHLTRHLISEGHKVLVLDNFSTGSACNLNSDPGNALPTVVDGSVCDAELVDDCTSQVDGVFHLAAAVGTFTIARKTIESLRTNLHGTEAVVEAACRHRVPLLLASTSEVYGLNPKAGLTEDDDRVLGSPPHSRWSYAEAKSVDETIVHAHVVEHGLDAVIARLFNTVGPGQSGEYGMVIPRFVRQALAGEPLTVFGDGTQVRCFCHVLDVVPALVALLLDRDARGEVFNVGGSDPVRIEDLARRVLAITGASGGIVHVPYDTFFEAGYRDTPHRLPDCAKARARIGFRPTCDLDEIISSVVADQRAHALTRGG
ncbi:NAD-dependent epimerase/dehydratase family protein [Saccharopolyspora rhizosphaerae]|uniref:NAD-dependent epimerase/dehydratase family protein n=1 Tax=Saccharopolyspora rhizosphaerae TaxID=2492662 RepID=A0A3R8QE27_9PSEU|nr:NAD-dependent epimerase/dehydratase family protein [Saccharopolyspora rhizosphaerae]RRO18865.1 NAD-dependent epimerase/dehydratase family protein [Saccharopolyspora rhizosphaerae]